MDPRALSMRGKRSPAALRPAAARGLLTSTPEHLLLLQLKKLKPAETGLKEKEKEEKIKKSLTGICGCTAGGQHCPTALLQGALDARACPALPLLPLQCLGVAPALIPQGTKEAEKKAGNLESELQR